ncbi:hypothetical protein HYT57_03255 [Candidatus Woesearchaeota archaeon]|nr:hypothetical protein [Candidatus Woesearchaeota archaeon]
MQKRYLVVFSLLLISILTISGCQYSAVGGTGGKLRNGQECGYNEECLSNKCEIIPGGRKLCTGTVQAYSATEGNTCTGLIQSRCKLTTGCKPIYEDDKYARCVKKGSDEDIPDFPFTRYATHKCSNPNYVVSNYLSVSDRCYFVMGCVYEQSISYDSTKPREQSKERVLLEPADKEICAEQGIKDQSEVMDTIIYNN